MTDNKTQTDPAAYLDRAPAALVVILSSLVWTHALAAVIRTFREIPFQELASASSALTWGALFVGVAASLPSTSRLRGLVSSGVAGGAAAWAIARLAPAAQGTQWALVPVAMAVSALGRTLVSSTPRGLITELTKGRWRTIAWIFVSLVAIVQIGRLSTYVTNPQSDWFLTTGHPFYAKHECSNAYFYAAELHDRGEADIYDPAHYPGLNPKAEPMAEMSGLVPEDPFQYPPPFLLLPAMARALSDDYAAIRSVWFALNVSFCLGVVVLALAWIGRRSTYGPLALAPLLVVAFPALHNFQYGQFHFAAVALATLGLLLLHEEKRVAGSALLGAAIAAKLFPLWALALLLGQKKYREVAMTIGLAGFYFLLGWWVLGSSPYVAFFGQHLARLSSGSAFAFGEAWPEVADLVTAGNQGIFGIVTKLEAVGFAFTDSAWAARAGTLYGVILIPALYLAGRRLGGSGRGRMVSVWLGALGLASLASAGAWADYVPLTGVWLGIVVLPQLGGHAALRWITVGVTLMQMTLVGTMPLGSFSDGAVLIPLSLVSALGLLGLFVIGVRKATFTLPAQDRANALRREREGSLGPASQPSPIF